MLKLPILAIISCFCVIIRSSEINLMDRNSNNVLHQTQYCSDLNPQNSLDIEKIMGMWFGSEVINHTPNDLEGEHIYDSCIVIHITEKSNDISTTDNPYQSRRQRLDNNYERTTNYNYGGSSNRRNAVRNLRLIWDERGQLVEYSLRFNNSRMGFWLSSEPQSGSMVNDMQYTQFFGTIQVMKAVGNQLVLTFCQNGLKNQLYSVILSRKVESLTYEDIQSIRGLLRRRELSTSSVRKVCSGSTNLTAMNLISVFAIVIIALSNFRKF